MQTAGNHVLPYSINKDDVHRSKRTAKKTTIVDFYDQKGPKILQDKGNKLLKGDGKKMSRTWLIEKLLIL